MEATPRTAYDALQVAIETETLILDKKDTLKMPIKISAVKNTEDSVEEEPEEDDEDAETARSPDTCRRSATRGSKKMEP